DFSSRLEATPAGRGTAAALQEQLLALLAEEQRLLERYAADHPAIVSVRKRIQVARNYCASPSAPWGQGDEPAGGKAPARPADPVEGHVQYLKQHLEYVRGSERLLDELFEREQDEVRKLDDYVKTNEAHEVDVAQTQLLLNGIGKRLHDVGMVK